MESSMNESKTTLRWQKKLLPFMMIILGAVALFFFISSFIQLYELQSKVDSYEKLKLDSLLLSMSQTAIDKYKRDELSITRWTTLSLLEWNALERRYHQANVTLMSRIWTRYLGFVTGMVLAIVGATFILGKLRETKSSVDLEFKELGKFVIASASPGLFLATFGTILMITTILVHNRIEVKDQSIYTAQWYYEAYMDTKPSKPQNLILTESNRDSLKKKGDDIIKKMKADRDNPSN